MRSFRIDALSAALAAGLALAVAGCSDGMGDPDARPTGPRDGGEAGVLDAAPSDGDTPDGRTGDGGGACGGVTCSGLEHCVAGACVPYPACDGAGGCPAGSSCHGRRCVPDDVDADGDGSPAGEDCDETNPDRSPELPEVCDGIDNDCDTMSDEGDPVALCESYPGGGTCISGNCGCPPGTFDLDRTMPGCECVAMPALGEGEACGSAIDLGNVADTMQTLTVTGNVMPDDREVWYRFMAVDTPDTACDAFHLRVLMMVNPADTFEFTVFQGDCGTLSCMDQGYTDFERYTDVRMDIGGMPTGECPCSTASPLPADTSACTDQSSAYFVRVRRRAGVPLSCSAYTIEISNGVY